MDEKMEMLDNEQDIISEEDEDIVYLTDEEGNEEPFEFIDVIGFEEKQYAVLLPLTDSDQDDTELLILEMQVDEEADTESFISVTDERVLTEVYGLFKDMYEDEFNFVD